MGYSNDLELNACSELTRNLRLIGAAIEVANHTKDWKLSSKLGERRWKKLNSSVGIILSAIQKAQTEGKQKYDQIFYDGEIKGSQSYGFGVYLFFMNNDPDNVHDNTDTKIDMIKSVCEAIVSETSPKENALAYTVRFISGLKLFTEKSSEPYI